MALDLDITYFEHLTTLPMCGAGSVAKIGKSGAMIAFVFLLVQSG